MLRYAWMDLRGENTEKYEVTKVYRDVTPQSSPSLIFLCTALCLYASFGIIEMISKHIAFYYELYVSYTYLFHNFILLCFSLERERIGILFLTSLLVNSLIPFMKVPLSWPNYLLGPTSKYHHIRDLGFNIWIWGGDTNMQPIADRFLEGEHFHHLSTYGQISSIKGL